MFCSAEINYEMLQQSSVKQGSYGCCPYCIFTLSSDDIYRVLCTLTNMNPNQRCIGAPIAALLMHVLRQDTIILTHLQPLAYWLQGRASNTLTGTDMGYEIIQFTLFISVELAPIKDLNLNFIVTAKQSIMLLDCWLGYQLAKISLHEKCNTVNITVLMHVFSEYMYILKLNHVVQEHFNQQQSDQIKIQHLQVLLVSSSHVVCHSLSCIPPDVNGIDG